MTIDPISKIQTALEKTLKHGTFNFDWFVGTREGVSIGGSGTGYMDLAVPAIATSMVLDVLPDKGGDIVTMPSFYSGTSIYQRVNDDPVEWVEIDVHGLGVTPVAPLYWLYGIADATTRPADTATRSIDVDIDFAKAVRDSPPGIGSSIGEGIEESHPGLSHERAHGKVVLSPDGYISTIEVDVPGVASFDPGLALPPRLVTLDLRPTTRRPIELPATNVHLSVQQFIDTLLGDGD
ncbi:hypothetical protein [Sinosporangium siamense]|uniref:Uncharacterized protein n=1 Tax=Sinosporangium siamense TaxID=1367973 RepID=A0A919VCP4_9ACTN|nr:hypothetical protein [Sinosporangium siamense]GII93334.1 hypothetical protein Ssi02_35650 [Sinosporangium siamense]